jgi:hypothetical protein
MDIFYFRQQQVMNMLLLLQSIKVMTECAVVMNTEFKQNTVPCWRYLLGITDSATQSFTLSLFPDHTVGIAIALLQPALTLTVLTIVLPVDSLIPR